MPEASLLFAFYLYLLSFCSSNTIWQNPWAVPQSLGTDWVMTGYYFSFWDVCLRGVLPSFLPSGFHWCLSLVSWANRQRRGRCWAWTTSNTRRCSRNTVRNREAVLNSVTVYHQKKQQKTKLAEKEQCFIGGAVRQVGRDASQYLVCIL